MYDVWLLFYLKNDSWLKNKSKTQTERNEFQNIYEKKKIKKPTSNLQIRFKSREFRLETGYAKWILC